MQSWFDRDDLYLFNTGRNCRAYWTLGCHRDDRDGYECYRFAVWAPHAASVSVVGSFNEWDSEADPMQRCGSSGVWVAYIGIARHGDTYKYAIRTHGGDVILKSDPFAFFSQMRPDTASIVYDMPDYRWHDSSHMKHRRQGPHYDAPMSVYEVHAGSWKHGKSFENMATELVDHALYMGYTHIELLPVSEYPLDDSWGYQATGYYSITSRYGTPEQFKFFIDRCHRAGLSVIVDWVPTHFCKDAHGLRLFDGTALYESADPRISEQPDWGTLRFDYSKAEVKSFLISNAVYLMDEFHVDGLRVDAVSCMLYLDYGRGGDWVPNELGGRENLGAIDFLRQLSETVHEECQGCLLIAEEATAFPDVTGDPDDGGLGFDFKWNMGFMNDTLSYMKLDSVYRRYHHDKLTFPMVYAFSERHVLPFSHDEVVYLKNSLIGRMKGSYADMFRQLRLLYMYQYAHPGKKLLFMGQEFGQFDEWDFRRSIQWELLAYDEHRDMLEFTRELNLFYKNNPPLYENDYDWLGFEWVSVNDDIHSVLAFIRRDRNGDGLLCVFNFLPVTQESYRMRMPGPVTLHQALSGVDLAGRAPIESCEDELGGSYVEVCLWPYEAVYYRMEE